MRVSLVDARAVSKVPHPAAGCAVLTARVHELIDHCQTEHGRSVALHGLRDIRSIFTPVFVMPYRAEHVVQ